MAIDRLDDEVRAILRCAVCELGQFRTPHHAVVNEAVKMCRVFGKASASGFVNAVLRQHLRSSPITLPAGDDPESLSVRYSHPLWLVRRYLDRHGPVGASQIMESHNREPDHYLWVNPLRASVADVCRRLERDQLEFQTVEGFPLCLRLSSMLVDHPVISRGLGFFMDLSSQRIAAAADLEGCGRIADLCAAPGGKSFLMAQRIRPEARIFASDISLTRLQSMRMRARLLGVPNLNFVQADLTGPPPYRQSFDCVLLDAPCSGLATLAHNPEIRWTFDPSSFDRMRSRQLALLHTAFSMLGPGREVVYSTCSSEPDENEEVVEQFLEEEPGARLGEPFRDPDSLRDGSRDFFVASIRHG